MLGVIGDVVADVVVQMQEGRRRGTDTGSQITTGRGGSAANVAAFAGPLHSTRFIGCVGADLAGEVVCADLRSHGVDVRVQRAGSTGVVVVLIDETGERTMFPSRGASGLLEQVPPAWLAGLDVLHLTGYSLQGEPASSSVLEAARTARDNGASISFDVSSAGVIESYGVDRFRDLLTALRPDVVSANADEAALLGLADADGAGKHLGRLGPAVLLARAGAEATRIFRGGELVATVSVPPVPDVHDTTGAGDAFNAGFLTAWMAGAGLVQACERAHHLARTVLGQPGARGPHAPEAHRKEEPEAQRRQETAG